MISEIEQCILVKGGCSGILSSNTRVSKFVILLETHDGFKTNSYSLKLGYQLGVFCHGYAPIKGL